MLFNVKVRHYNSHCDWLSREIVVEAESREDLNESLKKVFEETPSEMSPFYDFHCTNPTLAPHNHLFAISLIVPRTVLENGVFKLAAT